MQQRLEQHQRLRELPVQRLPEQRFPEQREAWVAAFPFVMGAVNHAMACAELRDMCFEDAEQAARTVYRSRLRKPPPRGELPAGAAVVFDVNHLVLALLVARDPIAHGADEALRNIIISAQQQQGSEAAAPDWTTVAQAFIVWFNAAAAAAPSAAVAPLGAAPSAAHRRRDKVVWVQGTADVGAWRFAASRRVGFPSRRAWAVFLMFKSTWAHLSGMPAFSDAELMSAPPGRRPPARAPPLPRAAAALPRPNKEEEAAAAMEPVSQGRWADLVDDEDD